MYMSYINQQFMSTNAYELHYKCNLGIDFIRVTRDLQYLVCLHGLRPGALGALHHRLCPLLGAYLGTSAQVCSTARLCTTAKLGGPGSPPGYPARERESQYPYPYHFST